jgi:hypothetical protein
MRAALRSAYSAPVAAGREARRQQLKKAAVTADIIWCPLMTRLGHRVCIAARGNGGSGKNRFARLLLDHLIGDGQRRFRNCEAERLGGLEVDDQFEFSRLLDRQIGWFLAFENAPSIDAGLL